MNTGSQGQAGQLSHRAIKRVFAGLIIVVLLASLDQTILATALPTIVGELGGLNALSWVFTAYMLTSTLTMPIWGKLSDLHGRKRLLKVGILLFIVGSAASGLSQSIVQLIVFRALQGVGAGAMLPMVQAAIGDLVPPRQRGKYIGYLVAVIAVSSVTGPLIGGLFVDHLTWRWAFYVNVPLAAVALIVVERNFSLGVPTRGTTKVDFSGMTLLTASVGSLLFVTVLGERVGWASLPTVVLAAAPVPLLALFLRQERRAPEPILPLELFEDIAFRLGCAMRVIGGTALIGVALFIPLFLQVSLGVRATDSGLLMAPLMLAFTITSTVGGRLIARSGRNVPFIRFGSGLLVVGMGLLSMLDAQSGRFQATVAMVLVGAAMGLSNPAIQASIQNSLAHRHMGAGTAFSSFFQQVGGILAVTFYGALLNAQVVATIKGALPPRGLGSLDPAQFLGSPETIAGLVEPTRSIIRGAVADGIGLIFLIGLCLAVLGFLISWRLPEKPLRDEMPTSAGALATEEEDPTAQ